jgi:acetolactate synthase-1/2/3 large subunit
MTIVRPLALAAQDGDAVRAVSAASRARRWCAAGSAPPVAFFAYPNKPRMIKQPDCEVHTLATLTHDI